MYYWQALREVKDNTVLYTNRAQTYIKLGKYPEAILDCEWAIRVSISCDYFVFVLLLSCLDEVTVLLKSMSYSKT